MSLSFKNNIEGIRENDFSSEDALDRDFNASENYDTPGHVRNLCFVWPDGIMKFMNYAYLISGEFKPEESVITLIFSTHFVIIHGRRLDLLYKDLLSNLTKVVKCADLRYNVLATSEDLLFIDSILIEKHL